MQSHPVFGDLVTRDTRYPGGRWMVRNANVPLDEILHLIDDGWDTPEILKRHFLVLRADLVEITLLHGLHG